MIGIFDSGVGGLCAYRVVRCMLPMEDLVYLADRKNAPYGTKSKDEIVKFAENNIRVLRNLGAERVLIACCSASTVHRLLGEEEREISVPIIAPAAALAAKSGRRITVIATRHTASEGAFGSEIAKISDSAVTELCEQELVSLVEGGSRDGRVSADCRAYLKDMAERVRRTEADTLILGCTHFSHLKGEIGALLPRVRIVSPAEVGAMEIVRKVTPVREGGREIYL